MKKGLLLLLAGLMAFYGVTVKAMADARIDAMSSDVREIEDIDLIWLYPNKVLDYKNTADFRLFTGNAPGSGSEWGGLIKDMSDQGLGTLGVYIGRPLALPTVANGLFTGGIPLLVNRYFGGVDTELGGVAGQPHPSLDLLWASDIGGANLGLHLTYADALGVAGTTNGEATGLDLSAGLGFSNVGSFSQGNIYAEYDSLGGYTAGGFSDIKVGTLWESALSTDNNLRLSGDLELDSAPANASALGGLLGVSCDHKVNGGKALVVSGLFIDYGNSTAGAVTATDWSWVWNGSVEAQAFDWLTLRAGIEHVLYNRNTINNATTSRANNNGDAFNTGFTASWQNWSLDGLVTAGSFEGEVNYPTPGEGIFFDNGNFIVVSEADLRYKF